MPASLHVATFNVHSFRAGVDAAAQAVSPANPHLLLIQECGSRRRVRRFARKLGLEVLSSHRPFHRVRNAILYPLEWRLAAFEAHDLSRQGRMLRRGLIAADLRGSGVRVTAVSAHLGLSGPERKRHAQELTDYLAAVQGPVVLGLDLNEETDGPAGKWIQDRLFDAWGVAGEGGGETFPARDPSARIDFLFVTEGVRVDRVWLSRGPEAATASDHRAVFAEIRLPES
jgi:endonuclease/exonuclease/phosphatase family metal-dependent hydrolase